MIERLLLARGARIVNADRRVPWTDAVGLARTVIALGTLGTLIFNNQHALFRHVAGEHGILSCTTATQSVGLFCLLQHRLDLARVIAIAGLLVVASGWRPRITGAIHWWIAYSFWVGSRITDGGDQVSVVLTTLMLPLALTDARRWHWQRFCGDTSRLGITVASIVAKASLWLVRLQVCIIYLDACIAKLRVDEWTDGTSLYYWLNSNYMGLPGYLHGILSPLLLTKGVVLLSWSVLALEFALGIALFTSVQFRMRLLPFAIMFHIGIAVFMGITSFAVAMLGALLLYLIPEGYTLRDCYDWYRGKKEPRDGIFLNRSKLNPQP